MIKNISDYTIEYMYIFMHIFSFLCTLYAHDNYIITRNVVQLVRFADLRFLIRKEIHSFSIFDKHKDKNKQKEKKWEKLNFS